MSAQDRNLRESDPDTCPVGRQVGSHCGAVVYGRWQQCIGQVGIDVGHGESKVVRKAHDLSPKFQVKEYAAGYKQQRKDREGVNEAQGA